ncbi:MAG: sialidase family protein [Planctomycetaceae bacterium]|jgi:hypothetical protein|nr:sialidase family protein [Planctomycetaceae bacterium]
MDWRTWRMALASVALVISQRAMPAADVRTNLPIKIYQPKRIKVRTLPAVRTPLGIPNDYKPWLARLKNGDLLVVAFCFGKIPSNKLKKGVPYIERAIFFRSSDGGKTWGPREERRDIHGREFALTVLSDGSLIMPCHFLSNDAFNKSGHTYSKVFRSGDNGKTWSEKRIGPKPFPARASTQSDWTAFELPDPRDRKKKVACIGVSIAHGGKQAPGNVFLWQSRDGGKTWDKTLRPDTKGWIDVDGFFCQSVTYAGERGRLLHVVRVDRSGPHWKLAVRPGEKLAGNDNADRSMLWISSDSGRSWRKHKDGGRFGTYGEMYPRFTKLADGRLMLTFTVRSGSTDGNPLGVRAILSRDDGETWDFRHDRMVISYENTGASGGGFGNTIQNADGSLVSVYSYRKPDGKTYIESVRWRLPE